MGVGGIIRWIDNIVNHLSLLSDNILLFGGGRILPDQCLGQSGLSTGNLF
jgi:hypothetical protein